jgi:hypothetical protein
MRPAGRRRAVMHGQRSLCCGKWGLTWAHLDDACGDRALTYSKKPAKRSNSILARWLCKLTGGSTATPANQDGKARHGSRRRLGRYPAALAALPDGRAG